MTSPGIDDGRGTRRIARVAEISTMVAAAAPTRLDATTSADLLRLSEDEKLARDVYLALYERWGLPPFGNIAGSEQAHMEMVAALLDHHGLADPVTGYPRGRFASAAMQDLHDTLVERGSRSQADAVRVGLLIEELDIADLRVAAARTPSDAVRAVCAELERGSRNHLRAFHRWSERVGADYAPEHLPAAEFAAIANSPHEDCGH